MKQLNKIKRVCILLTMCLVFALVFLSVQSSAQASQPRLVDHAGLLSDTEYHSLLSKLDEISTRQQFDVTIVTVTSTAGKSTLVYADNFYEQAGYGFGPNWDGTLLLVDMGNRQWHISTSGFGITALTDAGLARIDDHIVPDLSAGNFYTAFNTFADTVDQFVSSARAGRPVDVGNMTSQVSVPMMMVMSLGVGVVLSLIIVGVMASKMKSVKAQRGACVYVKTNSMKLRDSRDQFLYRNITRVPIPKNTGGGSSTHTSSSGRSFGGRGGGF